MDVLSKEHMVDVSLQSVALPVLGKARAALSLFKVRFNLFTFANNGLWGACVRG